MRLLMLKTGAEVVGLPEGLMTPREHDEGGTRVLQLSLSWKSLFGWLEGCHRFCALSVRAWGGTQTAPLINPRCATS